MEAMHVDSAGGKGMSLKVPDYCAVPGCSLAHRLLHDHGQDSWQKAFKIDLNKAWPQYAKASPHRYQWEENRG